MPVTTSDAADICVCRAYDLAKLFSEWRLRVRPLLQEAVVNGKSVNSRALEESSKLVRGIHDGLPEAFDITNRGLAHHLTECPLSCPVDEAALALLS